MGWKESGTTERLPDETVMWGGGERATRNAFSCGLSRIFLKAGSCQGSVTPKKVNSLRRASLPHLFLYCHSIELCLARWAMNK